MVSFHNRVYITDLQPEEGKEVILSGWVHEIRDLGKLRFVLLRDQTGIVQITAKKDEVDEKTFENIGKLIKESIILVKGRVKREERVKKGFEIVPLQISCGINDITRVYYDIHPIVHGTVCKRTIRGKITR